MKYIKPRSDLVILTTVYPGIERFFQDFLDSLENQDNLDFELLIANDGFDDLESWFKNRNISWNFVSVSGSVSSNRRNLITSALKKGYKKLVFTDSDDVMVSNRISCVASLLDTNDIVVNDLDIIDVEGIEQVKHFFSNRFKNEELLTADKMMQGNIMGLTNTAATAEVFVQNEALISGEVTAFDWYLWAAALHKGFRAVFTTDTSTRYRVYESNIAGLPQKLSKESIINGVKIKQQHYKVMSAIESEYSELYEIFTVLSKKLEDIDFWKKYLEILTAREIKYHMWWENIREPRGINE